MTSFFGMTQAMTHGDRTSRRRRGRRTFTICWRMRDATQPTHIRRNHPRIPRYVTPNMTSSITKPSPAYTLKYVFHTTTLCHNSQTISSCPLPNLTHRSFMAGQKLGITKVPTVQLYAYVCKLMPKSLYQNIKIMLNRVDQKTHKVYCAINVQPRVIESCGFNKKFRN